MMGPAISMKRRTKQRTQKLSSGTVLIAIAAVIFVLILLLRMMVFVTPHVRHHF
jgi:hypothetical protein